METEKAKSNSKFKLWLGLAAAVMVLLFAANLIIGNMLEKELAQNIEQKLKKIEQPIDFTYESLNVNPLFAQITFKEGLVKLDDPGSKMDIKWDKSVYQVSYADLFNLINEPEFKIDKVQSLDTKFDDLEITGMVNGKEKFDYLFSFSDLGIKFNGDLSRQTLKKNPQNFLKHNQNLELSFSDFEMDLPRLFNKILINSNLQEKLFKLGEVNLILDYTADNKNIKIEETVDSSYSSGNLAGDIKLLGENVENITGMRLDLQSKGDFEINNLKWGLAEKTGKYTIKKISGNSEFEIDREINFADHVKGDNMFFGNAKYDFNLEGLKIQTAGNLKQKLSANPFVMMSGINISEILLNNLNFIYQITNKEMRIKEAKLDSSVVDADGIATLELNNQYPNLSKINNFEVKLSDFKGNLRTLFEGIESNMGVYLPREGDAVVLKMKGTFANPQIKGVHY
ncbi:MAG: hypothetical protein ACQERJ_01540 [Bacillota bacterium]